MRIVIGIVLASIVALVCGPQYAGEVPLVLTHQGFILDSNGEPVDGEVAVGLALFDGPAAGAQEVWSQAALPVLVDKGFYTVEIPLDELLQAALREQAELYLEIRLGDEVGSPRQRLASVPYSLLCKDAVGSIHPASVSVGGNEVIDSTGKWVGDTSNLAGVKSVTATAPLTGGEITDSGTIGLPPAGPEADGYLSSAD